MGFLDTLRQVMGNESSKPARAFASRVEEEGATALVADGEEVPYDKAQWLKKLKRILDELPESEKEWETLEFDAKARSFEPEWITQNLRNEFLLLVRRVVADQVVTEAEHLKLDLARRLIRMPETEAVDALRAIVTEAESFFGKPVQDA